MSDRLMELEAELRDAVRRGRATSPQWIYAPLAHALDELSRLAPGDVRSGEIIAHAEQALDLWRAWLGEASPRRP